MSLLTGNNSTSAASRSSLPNLTAEKIGATRSEDVAALPFGQYLSLAAIPVLPVEPESAEDAALASDSNDPLPEQGWLDALLPAPIPIEVAPALVPVGLTLPEPALPDATAEHAVMPTVAMTAPAISAASANTALKAGDLPPPPINVAPPIQASANASPARQTLLQPVELTTSKTQMAESLPTPAASAMYSSVANGMSPAPAVQTATTPSSSALKLQGNEDQWSQQLRTALGERLQVQADNKVQHATIRLDPPDMGKIDITLHFEAGKLQVQINAGQQDVYRALQQASQELRQNLMQPNVQVDVQVSSQPSFTASQQQQQQQQQGQQASPHSAEIIQAQSLNAEAKNLFNDDSILMTV